MSRDAMSRRRVAGAVELELQHAGADKKHGCEWCRSLERRAELVARMVALQIVAVSAHCPDCGVGWRVRCTGSHVSFTPLVEN